MTDEQLLARVPLFDDLPPKECKRLANSLQILELEHNTVLIREGDIGDHFYIVIDGQVEVIQAMDTPNERLIDRYGPGQFVGEISLITPRGRRTASVITRGPTRVWRMTREDFDDLLHRQPMLAYKMVKVLGDRLTTANNQAIQDLKEKNIQLQTAYDQLKAAQAQIIEKERLEKELQVAYDIQMDILPHELPRLAGVDFGASIAPARAVGGDFYDIFPLNAHSAAVLIGDVTDKGVPSAIFMARIHALLSAEARQDATPRQVLQRVNDHILGLREAKLFTTVIYGLYNLDTGEFTYARAGHPLPLLSVPGGRAALAEQNLGQPLGVLDDPTLDENVLNLPQEGALLLYTDGITDCRNPQGEMFGMGRLKGRFEGLIHAGAQGICDGLMRALADFQGGASQDDDVTLIAIRRG